MPVFFGLQCGQAKQANFKAEIKSVVSTGSPSFTESEEPTLATDLSTNSGTLFLVLAAAIFSS